MRCTSPRTVGFHADGSTLCWSKKNFSKEFATFQLPCGKCIDCRLEYAAQWAIRCVHEAQMHENNIFLTLTYDNDHLGDNVLDYEDFRSFMKSVRKLQNEPIGFFATGEYGEKSKRKHWHAIIFNFKPKDAKLYRKTARGEEVFTSETITRLWKRGLCEFGGVTRESAGYCARYAAKKLGHGLDGEHNYEPISKKSNRNAIGKKWIEKHWQHVFALGAVVLNDGSTAPIPRYYERWLREKQPAAWLAYVGGRKEEMARSARARADAERRVLYERNHARRLNGNLTNVPTQQDQRRKISKLNLAYLRSKQKL